MRMKRIASLVPVCILIMALSMSAAAVNSFQKTRSYSDAGFSDVEQSQWYYNEVASAYELALMNGKGEGIFDPAGTVTVAEAIALASRMNSLYEGGDGKFTQTDVWYQVYVDYALNKGFLANGQFDTYARTIKRSEMVQLFANALPKEYFTAKNSVTSIPDVSATASYYDALLRFYNAGIVMGNDAFGTFMPNSDIKRSEVAAIVNRIAIPENRLAKTLVIKNEDSAHYLLDDRSTITSGWSIDSRGGIPGKSQNTNSLTDISNEYGVAFIRDISIQTTGNMTLETQFSIASGSDGLYYQFTDSDGKVAYKLFTDNGVFNLLTPDGTIKALDLAAEKKSYSLKVTVDLDAKVCDTIINSVDYGVTPFAESCKNIAQYKIGTSDEDIISAVPSANRLFANYTVNEQFNQLSDTGLPFGWTAEKSLDAVDLSAKSGELVYSMPGDSDASVKKTFDALTGKVALETIFYVPQKTNGISFQMRSGETIAAGFSTQNSMFYANDTMLYNYTPNVWYTIRIEADTDTQTAVIKVNHKIMGTVSFANTVSSIDNIVFSFKTADAATMKLDNVYVYQIPTEPQDYVPEPIPAPSDDYYVGINICSLWRNGQHQGWDAISPFDELKPNLGYYDDGVTEVSDWEIKYMVEHGIDFQLYCWYSSESNKPIKTTRLSDNMLYGFMDAKYSDKMKFALLWEAANGSHPSSSEAFRKDFVPYWVEYFFKDKRYMVIDNKPVIAVFGANKLVTDFGSESAVKAELDYVREVCRGLGFSGAIFMACSSGTDDASLTSVKNSGFDAVYAYNWGTSGYNADFTIESIDKQQNRKIIDVVPTISTGFNSVAWHATRFPNMSLDSFDKVTSWFKATALKKYAEGSWQSKFVMLSTWNEYGEGTYMMPSGLNGFGYLDHVRSAFTSAAVEHEDAKPDEDQIKRLGYLYPQNRAIIKPLRNYKTIPPSNVAKTWSLAADSNDWSFGNIESFTPKDGVLVVIPKSGDH